MQTTLDSEIRARSEAIRAKKKLEGDLQDLEIQLRFESKNEEYNYCTSLIENLKQCATASKLAHSNRQGVEASRALKVLQGQNKDLQIAVDDSRRLGEELAEQFRM